MRPPLTLRGLVMRRNSIMFIPTAIALCLLGALLWYQSHGIRHLLERPRPMTLARLSAMGNDAAGAGSSSMTDDAGGNAHATPTPTPHPRHHLRLMDAEATGNGHAPGKATYSRLVRCSGVRPQNAFTDALKSRQLASEAGSIMLLFASIAEAID